MYNREKIWSEADAATIHETALKLLEEVGMCVEEKQARDDLAAAGCRVDEEKHRVFFPKELVKQTLEDSPETFDMYDSNGEYYLTQGGEHTNIGTSGFAAYYLDREDDKIKPGTYKALEELVKLTEMLDEVQHIQTSIQPEDMTPGVQELYMTKCGLENTRKPLHLWPLNSRSAKAEIDMAALVMGGHDVLVEKPHISFNICTLSPLAMREDASEAIREAAKYKVPCLFTSGPMGGATSVATVAGETVQAWAEVVAHNVLLQIYCKGCPVTLASWSRIFDMKYAACTVGTPEFGLMRAAFAQLGELVGVPSGGGGFLTDSNTIDAQSGWEKLGTGLCALQAGMHQTNGVGMLSQLNVFSHEALVMDCETVRYARRILEGIKVDEEHIAYDLMAAEGGADGNSAFLKSKHTRKHFKKEWMQTDMTDRRPFGSWEKDPENQDIRKRTCKRIDQLLAAHSYSISEDLIKGIDEIIAQNVAAIEAEA